MKTKTAMPDVKIIFSTVKTEKGYQSTRFAIPTSEPSTPKQTETSAKPLKNRSIGDLKLHYNRLKYSEEKQKAMEAQMDQFLLDMRTKLHAEQITKRDAIDKCLLEKKYDQKLIMYATLSYQSTVYERAKLLGL